MNDHQLGTRLRQQILIDLQQGIRSDGRRLQALVGDLCSEQQQPLLPALKYLVISPAFSSAVDQNPPLPPDTRLQLRLQQELDQVFTTAICQRMADLLRGLLALPAVPPAGAEIHNTPDSSREAYSAETLEPRLLPTAAPPAGGRGVVAVLSFMAGVLVVGVVGGLTWLLQLSRQPEPLPLLPSTPSSRDTATPPPVQPTTPSQPPPAPDLGLQANAELAIAAVQQLYTDISGGNWEAARRLIGPGAADQFDPNFFSQFQQVRVGDLQESGRSGSSVTLSGVVTFLYADGTSQSESRSFTVDTANQPALITGSSFGQVLQPRS